MTAYSDWLKIDLHIHTDKSKETKHNDYTGNFDINILKMKLKELNVSIFSLTDHNIINVPAYEQYLNDYLEEDPLLLLGIELDIEVDPSAPKYHTLLIFNNNTIKYIKDINTRLERIYNQKGITNKFERFLTFEDIITTFKRDDFFFIPHSDKDGSKNIVSSYKAQKTIPELQRMVLLMHSALEKVTDEEMKQYYFNGFKRALDETFQKYDDIPYINFSDNHNCNKYPQYANTAHDHSFYYIKGSKSFETIRLAFIDPRSRIKSQKDYDNIDKTFITVESLKFQNNAIIPDVSLELSPHFNVIIGGRSSGKSLLLSLLGKRIDEVSLVDNNKYSNIMKSGEFFIKSSADAHHKNKTTLNQGVIYIKQGEITEYFESENLYSLVMSSKDMASQEYKKAQDLFDDKKAQFSLVVQNLLSTFKKIEDSNICNSVIIHNSDINLILDDKNYIFKVNISQLEDDSRREKQKVISARTAIENVITLLDSLKAHNSVIEWNDEENKVRSEFYNLLNSKKEKLSSFATLSAKKADFLSFCSNEITKANLELSSNSQHKQAAISRKNKIIQDVTIRFALLKELKDNAIKTTEFDHSLRHQIEIHNQMVLIREFVSDRVKINEIFLECIKSPNQKESLFINFLALLQNHKTVKQHSSNKWSELTKKVNTEIANFYSNCGSLKDFLDYGNGETSLNSSPGLNSEKYMDVLFESSIYKTFLIDQPEDNLSHTYIAEGLVNKIRENKYSKQFIVVTHNPSIVVYGDAECIILAEKSNNQISYRQLTLEDKNSQKIICATLDGGEYVFNNRSNKYNIRRIK